MKDTMMVIAISISTSLASPAFATDRAALDPKVQVETLGPSITASDIRYATFGVLYHGGGQSRQEFYHLAYVEKDGEVSILEGETDFPGIELSSRDIPARVMDVLGASMVTAIAGEQRIFAVGEKYDSAIRESDGTRPLFAIKCTQRESILGIDGYYLTIADYLRGTHEMDLIVSPSFPFPLYVREYTGSDPMQIILTSTRAYEPRMADLGEAGER